MSTSPSAVIATGLESEAGGAASVVCAAVVVSAGASVCTGVFPPQPEITNVQTARSDMIDVVLANNSMRVATGVLNEIVFEAVAMHEPPSDKGRRLKIFYATQVAVKPPTFVIFVNDKKLMHFSYVRYLENRIRESFGFEGTSLKFIIRERNDD